MAEDGAQPQGDAAAQASTQVAPALLWKPERVAADLKLSRQLIEKLDEEKGITSNPLVAADQLNGTSTGVCLWLKFNVTVPAMSFAKVLVEVLQLT